MSDSRPLVALVLIFVVIGILVFQNFDELEAWLRKAWNELRGVTDASTDETDDDSYQEGHPDYYETLLVSRDFQVSTVGDFSADYRLNLLFKRIDNEEFDQARMLDQSSQTALAESYNKEVFFPFLEKRSCFFRIDWRGIDKNGSTSAPCCLNVYRLADEGEKILVQAVPDEEIIEALAKEPWNKSGCEVRLEKILAPFTDENIKRNYDMLTKEQKAAILADGSYNAFEEALAVGALRRRLDFEQAQFKQSHGANGILIKTERAGLAFKIKWQFLEEAPEECELLGFKNAEGFHRDEFNEEANGELVVQAFHDNELVEFLKEGQTYYYTFILRAWNKKDRKYSVARFRVTMVSKDERREVEKTIERIEETLQRIEKQATMIKPTPDDPEKQHISKALKEVGLFVEFDTALDSKFRVLRREIENSDYSAEEKEEKLARLQDVVSSIRMKYEQ